MTAVLGGGIAGLTAAYEALKHPRLSSIVLFEATNRLGGWINSKKMPNGAIFEQGPRLLQIRSNHLPMYSFIDELNIAEKVNPILKTSPVAQNKLVYMNNKMHNMNVPIIKYLFSTVPPFKRPLITVVSNILNSPRAVKDDENIYTFINTRFGNDFADIIETLVCGVFAGNAHKISIKSIYAFNKIFEQEQMAGSMQNLVKNALIDTCFRRNKETTELKNIDQINLSPTTVKALQEKWYGFTLLGGTEEIVKSIIEHVSRKGVEIKTNHCCDSITFQPDHIDLVVNGKTESFEQVISALPAKKLAQLIEKQHPELANELCAIPTVTVAIVNLQYSGQVLPMEAFGFLVSPKENLPILGITFDSCFMASHDVSTTVMTVLMGGAWYDKYFGKNTSMDHLLNAAVSQVKNILHINQDPIAYSVNKLEDCIPQYYVGHSKRLTRIQNYLSQHKIPLQLCGSSYHGIGVSDTILSAREAVSFKSSEYSNRIVKHSPKHI